jgi:4-hydroxybenzoate polyprenyltransferase
MNDRDGAPRALVVDLDGTLTPSDLLWESLCSTAVRQPLALMGVPFWLAGGRVKLKQELAERGRVNVGGLPWREDVLELCRRRKAEGGTVVLATAAHRIVADKVAEHLGCFDSVLASEGRVNCKGSRKLEAVRGLLGDQPFDYVGDSNADRPLIAAASGAWLVDASPALRRETRAAGKLRGEMPGHGGWKPLVRLLRLHQSVKNLLIFVPVIAGHKFSDVAALASAGWAFLSFTLTASAVYVFNDLCDLESDRNHPAKKGRPLAAGRVAIPAAIVVCLLLAVAGFGIAAACVGPLFTAVVAGYAVLTTAYSLWLKRKVFLDVLLLAGLYSYRIFAGGVATDILLSKWLIIFSMFFFLCLAIAKRYCELDQALSGAKSNASRGYRPDDLSLLRTLGPTAGFMSVLVMALYVSSESTQMYPRPQLLWLVCPILLYWITRIWFLAQRREMQDDPVVFALRDWRSLVAGAITAGIVLAASLRF